MKYLFFTLAFSLNSQAFGLNQNKAQELVETFKETMIRCPERIWPNYKWDDHYIVLAQSSSQTSWLWETKSDSLIEKENSDLPISINGPFSFFDYNGKPAMSLNSGFTGDSLQLLHTLGVHEFFHNIGQADWEHSRSGSRGTFYPIEAEPRLYRSMIYKNLLDYFFKIDLRGLEKARYWFDKWTTEYPLEVSSTTDGYEGTANYVDSLSYVISQVSCSVTDRDLELEIQKYVKNNWLMIESGYISLDGEGYEIGGIASLILRFSRKDLTSWTERAAHDETPLEVLLENISPLPNAIDQTIEKRVREAVFAAQTEMEKIMEPAIKLYKDQDIVLVSAPFEMSQGAFQPMFFALVQKLDTLFYPLAAPQPFQSIIPKGSKFEAHAGIVSISNNENPCPSEGFDFLVKFRNPINEGQIELNVTNQFLTGRLAGEVKFSSTGKKYLCLQ